VLASQPSQRGHRYQHWTVLSWSSRGWLQHLRAPTLGLDGVTDLMVPLTDARSLAERIPGRSWKFARRSGHLLLSNAARASVRVPSTSCSSRAVTIVISVSS
jgi:pimeloyl-ACP methyl ester carboxylesterase